MRKESSLLLALATTASVCVPSTNAFAALHHRPLHIESPTFQVQRRANGAGSTWLGSSVADPFDIADSDPQDEPDFADMTMSSHMVMSTQMTMPADDVQRRRPVPWLDLMGASAAAAVGAALVLHPEVLSMVQQMPMEVWDSYERILAAAPIATKAVTSATVYTIGDVIAQRTEATDGIDYARTTRSMLAGLIGHGPLSHYWYHVSDNLFENILHLTAWWSLFPKVALDQMFWGPIWNNTYIILLGIMKLQSPGKIWADIKRTTIPLVLSGLKLWPLAHCVTYGLVPVENRLLWVDAVEILWVTILATQAAAAPEVDTEQKADQEVVDVPGPVASA